MKAIINTIEIKSRLIFNFTIVFAVASKIGFLFQVENLDLSEFRLQLDAGDVPFVCFWGHERFMFKLFFAPSLVRIEI
jgi:hypothetical protein